jgi:hypothetical protein
VGGENYVMMILIISRHFTKCCYGDCVKEDEVGGTRSTHAGNEKCISNLGRKTLMKGRVRFGDLVDGSIILTLILRQGVTTWAGFIWPRMGSSGELL